MASSCTVHNNSRQAQCLTWSFNAAEGENPVEGLSNHTKQGEKQDTDGPRTRLSPLSEWQYSLEGTMGKGQEKGGSIVRASWWLLMALLVDQRPCLCFCFVFFLYSYNLLETSRDSQARSEQRDQAIALEITQMSLYQAGKQKGVFSLSITTIWLSKCRLTYWWCWLDSQLPVCAFVCAPKSDAKGRMDKWVRKMEQYPLKNIW